MDIKQKSFAEEDQNGMELKPKTIHRLANGLSRMRWRGQSVGPDFCLSFPLIVVSNVIWLSGGSHRISLMGSFSL